MDEGRDGYDDAIARSAEDRAEATFDWGRTDSVGALVVSAAAQLSDATPTDLEPLHARFDPDALDALFRPVEDGRTPTDGTVEFSFEGYRVTVHGEGRVVVERVRKPAK